MCKETTNNFINIKIFEATNVLIFFHNIATIKIYFFSFSNDLITTLILLVVLRNLSDQQ
jgi:hypothetical protein